MRTDKFMQANITSLTEEQGYNTIPNMSDSEEVQEIVTKMEALNVKGNAGENTESAQFKDSSFVLTTLMGIKDNKEVIAYLLTELRKIYSRESALS